MGLQRHHPVGGRQGPGQYEDDDAGAAQHLQTPRRVGIRGLILSGRPAVQQIGQHAPNDEVGDGADDEEGLVQKDLLLLQNRVRGHDLRVRPLVQLVHAQDDRHREEGHQPQGARARFEHTPDSEAPAPPGEMVHHQ